MVQFLILLFHMAYKSLSSITVSDIESHGIAREDAATLHQRLAEIIAIHGDGTPATWQHISNSVLHPEQPFSFHQILYYGCYKDYGPDPPSWIPVRYVNYIYVCVCYLFNCVEVVLIDVNVMND